MRLTIFDFLQLFSYEVAWVRAVAYLGLVFALLATLCILLGLSLRLGGLRPGIPIFKSGVALLLLVFVTYFGLWFHVSGKAGRNEVPPNGPTHSGHVDGTVALALSDVIVFRTPNGDLGAIRIDEVTAEKNATYTAWYLPAGGSFSFESAPSSRGQLSDRLERTRTGLQTYRVRDLGSVFEIQCGPIKIPWSYPTQVYIPQGYSHIILPEQELMKLRFDDPALPWYTVKNETHHAHERPPK
jgi:hypothetical protein